MFKSIRWKFILIYFLLVFLAMSIVGIYIVNQLEKIQLDMNIKTWKLEFVRLLIPTAQNPVYGMITLKKSKKHKQCPGRI